ncbi:MAG: Sua5/YciO/YrdC/YwlC family protein [Gemmataceae bacterium]
MGSMHTKPADSPEALAEAMDHLRAGRLVGVPSDTGYGFAASALHLDAVARLHALNGGPLLLALTFPVEVFDWLPYLTGVGVRLARRFWPGPLALAGNQGVREGLLSCLPDNVRRSLAPDGFLPLTVPAQPQLRRLLHGFAAPILLAEATTAAQFAVLAAGAASLVLDAGPAPDEGGRTLLQLDGRRVRLLREGAVGLSEIDDALPCRVLFVCTGNTCRSPIAKALCEKMLADWLGCDAADLPKRGYLVQSAGLAALAGEGPSPEGVEAIRPGAPT